MNTQYRKYLKDWVYKQQKGRCTYCNTPVTRAQATLDHIVPRSLGGGNNKENLCLACQTCNETKGSMTPQVWRQHLEIHQGTAKGAGGCSSPSTGTATGR